jgi:ABC-2 type transport system ATP-binding protein
MSNMTTDTVLTISDLCLGIGRKKVLNHIDLRFEKGEAVLIAGNNGSGKSSLLRCIAGVYFPDSGTIRFGDSVTKRKIGFISDKMSLFEHFTLRQGIDFHCDVFGIEKFDDSLPRQLNIRMDQRIRDLSSGERALYHLSLVMSQKPEILLVDEIIHTIDPYLRELFLEGLIEMMDSLNTTVIMINHTFSEMGRIPERVLILENGTFILDEKTEELARKMKKIVSEKELDSDIPVIFKKESAVYNEYYVYPFTDELEAAHAYEFQDIDLSETIKSFIGGYYAKKRS